ncbi:hypothetical protein A2914_01205 [Candidatus Nomurabacteria bacterium RIFCSPLOWO2_01_FULL_41_21]|uniref:Response regulatory domain-containing protein n=2 Tax=Candidatus Nomuraibacteriota TaxID=1752729 RepID=A0A1F6V2D3_9BACT|nr:MAG: hypothetical protein A2733_02295 [Candidatus Nomurabacteria bacterium RIFCSPHIGHO2_01_FULL_40_20]OGI87929.1 MAG: hypothetical protein A2914_01205 [Candidatus Nomurabacteria bacterium RIFCSPLOWO2_01_FULL_41_21]
MENKKRKILIVDDDSFLLDMYAFKFNQNDFEVYTFLDGGEALKKLREGLKPDVLIVDIIMPGLDGFEVLEKINSDKLCEDATKIVLSNKSQQADIDRCKALGVASYIVKANSTPAEVIDEVKRILDGGNLAKKIK